MKYQKSKIILALIFIFALFIRLYNLGNLPLNFHEDEILTGYVGRFILHNGVDLYGNSWPLLYFNKFGDYYIIGPMYLKGLSTYLFGMTEFAVRFPSALFGALIVFPTFYICRLIFKKDLIGLFSAFFITIVPWHLVLSRASAEGIIGTTIYFTTLYYLLKTINDEKYKNIFISTFLFLITYFIYHPFRVLAPITIFIFLFFYHTFKNKKMFKTLLIIGSIFLILTAYIGSTKWGSGRLSQTSIFGGISLVPIKTQEFIFDDGGQNVILTRIFHNKVLAYGKDYLRSYMDYFSPDFLFFKGTKALPYIVPDQGVLYIFFLILFIVCLIPIKKNIYINQKLFNFVLIMLFVSALPAGLTLIESPNIHRATNVVVFICMFAGYGFYKSFFIKYKKISLGIILIPVMLLEIFLFSHQYINHFDLFTSINRNDGQKNLVEYLLKNKNKYNHIYLPVSGTMPLYYLFYKQDFNIKYSKEFALDARIKNIDNLYFVDNICISQESNKLNLIKNDLVIDSMKCLDEQNPKFKEVTRIKGKNNVLGFKLLIPIK